METPSRILLSLGEALARRRASRRGTEAVLDQVKLAILVHDHIDVERGGLEVAMYDDMAFAQGANTFEVPYQETFEVRENLGLVDAFGNSSIREHQTVGTIRFSLEPLLAPILPRAPFIRLVPRTAYGLSVGDLRGRLAGQTSDTSDTYQRNTRLQELDAALVSASIAHAATLGDALILDAAVHRAYHTRFSAAYAAPSPTIREHIFTQLVHLRCPRFDRLDLSATLALRADPLWSELRHVIGRIADRLRNADPTDPPPRDQILTAIALELFAELSARAPTGRSVMLDIGLNAASLIPGLGVIAAAASTGKAIRNHQDAEVRWLSFLDHLEDAAGGEGP